MTDNINENQAPEEITPPDSDTIGTLSASSVPEGEELIIWGGENKPRIGDGFYYIGRKLEVHWDMGEQFNALRQYCSNGNCFKTRQAAQAVLDVIKQMFTPMEFE